MLDHSVHVQLIIDDEDEYRVSIHVRTRNRVSLETENSKKLISR